MFRQGSASCLGFRKEKKHSECVITWLCGFFLLLCPHVDLSAGTLLIDSNNCTLTNNWDFYQYNGLQYYNFFPHSCPNEGHTFHYLLWRYNLTGTIFILCWCDAVSPYHWWQPISGPARYLSWLIDLKQINKAYSRKRESVKRDTDCVAASVTFKSPDNS